MARNTQSTTSHPLPSNTTDKAPSPDKTLTTTKSRTTATHVFFWGGTLSNWHIGTPFSGARALNLLTAELATLSVAVPHPSANSIASRLIRHHTFNCGEQWMMSIKAWLFEPIDNNNSDDDGKFDKLRGEVLDWRRPKGKATREIWEGSLCRILREKAPRKQKALGRTVAGFDVRSWDVVSKAVVTVGCVVRAEADPQLRGMYLVSEDKKFVEGSPRDVIWGVGIHWMEPTIEDPALWLGENRLGVCHDEAARRVRELAASGNGGGSGSEVTT